MSESNEAPKRPAFLDGPPLNRPLTPEEREQYWSYKTAMEFGPGGFEVVEEGESPPEDEDD